MAAGWQLFINALDVYNKSLSATEYSQYVDEMSLQYDVAIKTATNQFQHIIIPNGNKERFKIPLMTAMEQCCHISDPETAKITFANGINQAVIMYWTGAMLAIVPPAPGMSVITINTVVSPGVCAFTGLKATKDTSEMPRKIAKACKNHLTTVSGIATGLTVPVPPAPPLPISVPWLGLS